ncbi:60S ribosomal protein L14, putative [Plasmodium ovale wallikeri]|uniref:60S ribosomal protein L14, putative n=1 Tax=Plasmodium ovale wallikeri TaxID=864142 RepID=A0A1A8ZP16_PLAOA|nr:60S ribosomal protein L14, putative [Plasmodium ovale wallikeri]SBT45563.1 60S ribosomal protein L14, putative [Plasmodium ovale wallikeri]
MPRTELTEEEKLNIKKKNLLFKRFVEPGRVPRMVIPLKRLKLLKERINISKNCKSGFLRKTIKSTNVLDTFNKSNLGKKMLIKKKRDLATDYERFQIFYAKRELKKKMNILQNKKVSESKKENKGDKKKAKKVKKVKKVKKIAAKK